MAAPLKAVAACKTLGAACLKAGDRLLDRAVDYLGGDKLDYLFTQIDRAGYTVLPPNALFDGKGFGIYSKEFREQLIRDKLDLHGKVFDEIIVNDDFKNIMKRVRNAAIAENIMECQKLTSEAEEIINAIITEKNEKHGLDFWEIRCPVVFGNGEKDIRDMKDANSYVQLYFDIIAKGRSPDDPVTFAEDDSPDDPVTFAEDDKFKNHVQSPVKNR